MKLFMVGASPYARKVRAVGVTLGLTDGIEIVIANPHERPAELLRHNPLSKVPTLVADDGEAIVDSLSICEYLCSLVEGQTVLPVSPGPERRRILFRHDLAHGVMDCGVVRRVESLKAEEPDRMDWMARQVATIGRVLDWFEASDALHGPMTLDRLTLASALGFLDFRFPDDGWRNSRPRLSDWYAEAAKLPALAETEPFA
ncbi:glutathione S-transferase family protein [Nisaea acidiphila]|uniref:Glutathione S-transferase family protein n=1 Tax=Nisaea acidiphila TaxID=1862145 RepID=A0A9J7ANQ8_9PROT|nr:glutathione S-transferase family protein [Nisaea acidiphila]UUX49267.1 glutathione S-transferase family protein [Nisaea acidiphila]